ncbi:MAG: aldo/keto reductase [Bacteroidales bacterium]|nr:aldo/keto reductase [Bacteroidales bacterium]
MISECENSLKRLGTDRIDLYFAHTYDDTTPVEESMEAFHWLKKQGKIRYAGASNHYTWQIAEANAKANRDGWEGFSCIQQRHTYLEPSIRSNFGTQLLLTPEMQKYAAERKLTLMAYSPLLGGAYGRPDRSFPVQYQCAVNEFKLARLTKVADELGVSPNTLVLAWMLQDQPGVMPIAAASNTEQMKENLKALTIQFTKDQMESLQSDIAQPNKYS